MAVIAKNNTGDPVTITDLGVTIPGSGQVTLSDYMSSRLVAGSADLNTLVWAETVTMNDGASDVAKEKYIGWIASYPTDYLIKYAEDIPGRPMLRDVPPLVLFDTGDGARYLYHIFPSPPVLVDVVIAFDLPSDFSVFKRTDTNPAGSALRFHAKTFIGTGGWTVMAVYDTNGVAQTAGLPPRGSSPVRTEVTIDGAVLTGTYEADKRCHMVVQLDGIAAEVVGIDVDSSRAGIILV